MNNHELANLIVEYIGGVSNIDDAFHCMTRLRFQIKDKNKVDLGKLKKLEKVIEVRYQGDQLQVVIGNDVQKVWKEMSDKFEGLEKSSASIPKKGKIKIGSYLMELISGIFGPILPAITGAGLMKGILPLLVLLGWIKDTSDTYVILNVVGDSAFYFLPILIAISASRKFKVNEFYGVTVAAAMLYPTIMNGKGTFKFLNFIPIPAASYASTVIPIILTIWALSYIYKAVYKVMPQAVTIVFTPLLTFAIAIPLALAVFGPLGDYVGKGLVFLTGFLKDTVPWLYGAVITGLAPLAVMTGMSFAFWPGMFAELAQNGYESGFLVLSIFSNMAMTGATLGAYFRLKKKENKTISFAAFISAAFGITEPALYGVALKYKKPLYANMAAAAIVGAIMMTMKIKMYAFSAPNVFSMSLLVPPKGGSLQNLYVGIFGVALVLILSFVFSLILGVDEDATEDDKKSKKTDKKAKISSSKNEKNVLEINAPVLGEIHPLSDSKDEIFKSGKIGKGIIIYPTSDNTIYAPFDGKVVSEILESKHAIGITSDEGIELLVHIGIDTVNMNGDGFNYLVKEGDSFNKGDKLMTFDLQKIKDAGYDPEILVAVLNAPSFFEVVIPKDNGEVNSTENIMLVLE